MQVVHVVDALFRNQLFHLCEDGLILFIEGALVQSEVLMVQIEAFVLLVDLLGEVEAERFDLLVQDVDLLCVALRGNNFILVSQIGSLQRLGRTLKL